MLWIKRKDETLEKSKKEKIEPLDTNKRNIILWYVEQKINVIKMYNRIKYKQETLSRM